MVMSATGPAARICCDTATAWSDATCSTHSPLVAEPGPQALEERRDPRAGGDVGREDLDDFLAAAGGVEPIDAAVVDLAALVDHDDAFAQFLDVGHVVAGQQDGRAVTAVVVAQERADRFLGDHVEADRRFVEEEDAGPVEQGRDQLHLHPLTERQLADHDVELRPHVEEVDELVERLLVLAAVEPVDVPQEQERLDRGQVPPELVLLAQHEGEQPAVGVLALRRVEAGHPRPARRRVDQAGEHFQRRGLAGAVGAEEADELALGDGEADVVRRADLLELAPEQALHAAPEAGLLFVGPEDAREMLDFDHRRR